MRSTPRSSKASWAARTGPSRSPGTSKRPPPSCWPRTRSTCRACNSCWNRSATTRRGRSPRTSSAIWGTSRKTSFAAYEEKGYLQNEQVGLTGLETSFEDALRGKPGRQTIEVDVNGRRVRTVGEPDSAQPGHNLVLSLDLDLQRAATEALQEALDKSRGLHEGHPGRGHRAGPAQRQDPGVGQPAQLRQQPVRQRHHH